MIPQRKLGPFRQSVQWITTLVLLLIPFVKIGGESLLRLDAPNRTLLFFGAAIRIEELYLFLLATLILVFIFLFVTMVFGRIWCGWLCPQTTLSDLAGFILKKTASLLPGKLFPLVVAHLLFALLAFLVGANLVWYFIPPAEFFERLLQGNLGLVAGITLWTTAVLVYLDLAFVRRLFCSMLCPYGRIQLMAMDRNTLTLEFNPARTSDCIRCGACVRTCPTGIDIRDGLQVECINCGRCLDTCRAIMQKLGKTGLIHYSFGITEQGGGRPLNSKSLVLGIVVLVLCGLLAAGVTLRKEASLKVRRADMIQVKHLADGSLVNFFTITIENRSRKPAVYDLVIDGSSKAGLELLGPVTGLLLAANDNRRIDLLVKASSLPPKQAIIQLRLMQGKRVVAAEPLSILD